MDRLPETSRLTPTGASWPSFVANVHNGVIVGILELDWLVGALALFPIISNGTPNSHHRHIHQKRSWPWKRSCAEESELSGMEASAICGIFQWPKGNFFQPAPSSWTIQTHFPFFWKMKTVPGTVPWKNSQKFHQNSITDWWLATKVFELLTPGKKETAKPCFSKMPLGLFRSITQKTKSGQLAGRFWGPKVFSALRAENRSKPCLWRGTHPADPHPPGSAGTQPLTPSGHDI